MRGFGAALADHWKVRLPRIVGEFFKSTSPGHWCLKLAHGLCRAIRDRDLTCRGTDPRHLYHDVLVAVDEARQLNNGPPSDLAFLIEALELELGAHIVIWVVARGITAR